MKLSYILPIYNVEKYLRECVDSILSQTFDDYEIILVDDESPDSCPAICDEYAERYPDIVRVIHQKNKGLAGARNSGLEIAVGDYVYFFDSDDCFVNDGIAAIFAKAIENDVDILQNSFVINDESNGKKSVVQSTFSTNKIYSHDEMQRKIFVSTSERSTIFVWRNLYKRSFLNEKNIRFDENLRMIEDSPFNTLAFAKAQRFVSVDIPIYCYRLRNNSLQRQKYVENYDIILEYQWKQKLKFFSENCEPRQEFFADIAEYTIKNFLPMLLSNVYSNKIKNRYEILKRIAKSEMIQKSFIDYDINNFKSKSLDWVMTKYIRDGHYLAAHILCEKVLYK